jgi:hypothetical protein
MWLSLAVAQGDEEGRSILDSIERQITPDQIAEAQKRAAAWKPKANSMSCGGCDLKDLGLSDRRPFISVLD